MKFNVNSYVKVRLTDHGRRVYREEWMRVLGAVPHLSYRRPQEDEQGWSSWQMWSLMSWFGPYMGLAQPNVFETEIEIVVDEPRGKFE